MVKRTASYVGNLRQGYTLVELLIVLAIVAFMGVLTLYGFTSQNKDQRIINSQREMVVNLRSLQTRVNVGVGGKSFKKATFVDGQSSYTVDGVVTPLNVGVTLSVTPSPVTVFFAHPNYPGHLASQCGVNPAGATFFACVGPTSTAYDGSPGKTTVKIGFVGSTSHFVTLEGSGMIVNRIYESNN